MKAVLTREIIHSITSLGVITPKEDVANVLMSIKLQRNGDALEAVTTDRYVAVIASYNDVLEFENWADGDGMMIDPRQLKSVSDMLKRDKRNPEPVSINYSFDTNMAYAEVSEGTTVDLKAPRLVGSKFPPIERFFEVDSEPDGVPSLGLNPDFIAKLGKILPPEVRPDRTRVWRFQFRSTETGKPGPVWANYEGLNYNIRALVQPALIK